MARRSVLARDVSCQRGSHPVAPCHAEAMQILVLGGTGWLGRTVAELALQRGHAVTVTSRGLRGEYSRGAEHVTLDRAEEGAIREMAHRTWDAVVDVGMQPGQVRDAAHALALAHAHTRYVFISSCSVYATHDVIGATESMPLLPAFEGDVFDSMEHYGNAKVACEELVQTAFDDRALIVRPGLIAGPGDRSDRTGYWPLRFARNAGSEVLVPDDAAQPTQVIDVRDLAAWVVLAVEQRLGGAFDLVGASVPLATHLKSAAYVAGTDATAVALPGPWLLEHEVTPWAGPCSLPLWVGDPDWVGFMAHTGAAARAEGFVARPLDDTYRDTLLWEQRRVQPERRLAGLSDDDEQALLRLWREG